MNKRPIPASQQMLPVIGCGTYLGFDHAPSSPAYARLPAVLDALFGGGGSVLDSSPMYGRAETTTGELLSASPRRDAAFVATKVWVQGKEAGIRQMEQSMAKLGTRTIDLMQIHNLVDWRRHLATLRQWKDDGRVRYLGISHYTSSAYREVEAVLLSEPVDFLQINYSWADRAAEQRLLPLAADKGVAVLANMPFGGGASGGGLLRRLAPMPLPPWAADIGCSSWSQVMLKFVLSHPAVTCVIPGTADPAHMADNMQAGAGVLPTPEYWTDKRSDIAP